MRKAEGNARTDPVNGQKTRPVHRSANTTGDVNPHTYSHLKLKTDSGNLISGSSLGYVRKLEATSRKTVLFLKVKVKHCTVMRP